MRKNGGGNRLKKVPIYFVMSIAFHELALKNVRLFPGDLPLIEHLHGESSSLSARFWAKCHERKLHLIKIFCDYILI